MKTAQTIEEQPERKAARDNADQGENQAGSSPTPTPPERKKSGRGDASRIAKWQWKKGFAPNPTGKNGWNDLAAVIARAAFENNAEALYKAFSKALLKGNAYAFKELSDRAYGRLKERIELQAGPLENMSVAELETRHAELQRKVGLATALERITELEREVEQLRALPPAADSNSKPN